MKQTKFEFKAQTDDVQYIDLTKAMTLTNGQVHYPFKNDKPLAYMVTVRQSDNSGVITTAGTSWAVRNACVKTAAAWRRMLKKAGVRKKDLNKYGKELRVAFDSGHTAQWGRGGVTGACDLVPEHLMTGDVCEYETGTYREDGSAVRVTAYTGVTLSPYGLDAGGLIFREHAFDHTQMTVPDSKGNVEGETGWKAHLLGNNSLIKTYINSRGNQTEVRDDDFDNEVSEPDNYLTLMLSDNEESADDVIENLQQDGDYRPYSLDYQNIAVTAVGANANVQGQDSSFVAPLGLMKWDPRAANDTLTVTVTAIAEF